ncbi:hypothetical protein Tco_0618391 [Tanacetum coccineum]
MELSFRGLRKELWFRGGGGARVTPVVVGYVVVVEVVVVMEVLELLVMVDFVEDRPLHYDTPVGKLFMINMFDDLPVGFGLIFKVEDLFDLCYENVLVIFKRLTTAVDLCHVVSKDKFVDFTSFVATGGGGGDGGGASDGGARIVCDGGFCGGAALQKSPRR